MVNDSKSHRQRHQTQKYVVGWRLVFYTLELGAFKCPESAHMQKRRSIVFVRALWSRCAVRLERHPIDWNGKEFLFGGAKKKGGSPRRLSSLFVMGQNIPAHRFHSLPITNERESHAESHASCI